MPLVPSFLILVALGGIVLFSAIAWRLRQRVQGLQQQLNAGEEALAESDERFAKALLATSDYVTLTEFGSGVMIDVNLAFQQAVGMRREEMLGMRAVDLGIWANEGQREEFKKVLREKGEVHNFRFDFRNGAGKQGAALITGIPVRYRGRQCLLNVVEDISEKEGMRRQLELESERFRALCNTSSFGVCVVVPPGKLSFYNSRYLEITGQTAEQIAAGETVTRWHPDEQAEALAEWQLAISLGRGFSNERRYVHGDGKVVWTRGDMIAVGMDRPGGYFVCLLEDITASKQADQALREREGRLSAMFELLPDYVSLASFKTGQLLEVNRAYELACGLSREQLIGRRADDLNVWDAAAQQRFAEHLRQFGHMRDYREFIRRADGSRREVIMNATMVKVDGRTCVLNVARDIEEQESMRRQLDLESERFRSLAESSPFGICVVEPPVKVTYYNARYLAITGRQPEELGQPTPNWHADDVTRSQAEWEEAFRLGRGFSSERRFVHADGHVVWTRLHASPLLKDGQVYGFVCTLEDISDTKAFERELREREERFALVFEMIPDVLTIARADNGKLVNVNRNWAEAAGIPREESIGRSVIELGVWTQPQQRAEMVARLKAGGEVRSMPVTFHHATRGEFPAVISANLVRTADVEYLMVLTHDMTNENRLEAERRRAELEMQRTAEQLRSILSVMAEGVLVRDRNGRIVLHNAAAQRICGLSDAEIVEMADGRRPLVYAESGERMRDIQMLPFARVRQSGQGVAAEVLGLQGHHGDPITWVLVNAQPVFAADGSVDSVVSTFTDITSLKATEKALREREEQFVTLFQMSPAAMSVARHRDGVLMEVNDAWVRQFGYRREDAVGNTVAGLRMWTPADRERVIGPIGPRGQVDGVEVVFRRLDGQQLTCLFSARTFSFQGEDYILALPLDVTRQREIEAEIRELNQQLEARVRERTGQLETANQELATTLNTLQRAQDELVRSEKLAGLGSIVAGVAHELNTPIGNSVTVASSLHDRTNELLAGYASGSLRRSVLEDYLNNAKASADLLLRNLFQAHELVSNFKQVAVDQASAQRREFDLAEVVNEVVATLVPMYKKTPYRMSFDLQPGIVMNSYPGPLGQVLNNLVVNSLVHGFEGRAQGQMRIACRMLADDQVEIDYSDDGVGIAAENVRRVFDPFFTTKLGRGGSGLGLNIVYNIATRVLGGKVQLESQPDQGVRFVLTLPRMAPGEHGGGA